MSEPILELDGIRIDVRGTSAEDLWPDLFRPGTHRMKVLEAMILMNLVATKQCGTQIVEGRKERYRKRKGALYGKIIKCPTCRGKRTNIYMGKKSTMWCHDCMTTSRWVLIYQGSTIKWQTIHIDDFIEMYGP